MSKHELLEFIAKSLYGAYCNHTGWKSAITGAQLPPWDEVAPAVRSAWHATASAAAAIVPPPTSDDFPPKK